MLYVILIRYVETSPYIRTFPLFYINEISHKYTQKIMVYIRERSSHFTSMPLKTNVNVHTFLCPGRL